MAKKAGHGRTMDFFGSFNQKKLAVKKERKHPGSFIRKTKGHFIVMKPKGR